MKQHQGKYLIYIGIALILVGVYVFFADLIIGVIALFTGIWTAIKGYRVSKGIKPFLIKKHEQREQEELDKYRNVDPFDPEQREEEDKEE